MRRKRQRKSSPAAIAAKDSAGPPRGGGQFARATLGRWLEKHFYLRLHMTLIIALTFLAGMAATNALTWMQANPLALRYGLASGAAYLAFLAMIRIWLWYVGIRSRAGERRSGVDLSSTGIDVSDLDVPRFLSDLSPGTPSPLDGGGGSFGGGGATGSWGDSAASSSVSPARGDGGGGFSLDVGDDAGVILLIVVIVLAAVVAALASLYLIYSAPAILAEVAFQGVLAAAMARRTRQMSNLGWMGAVFRRTFWVFAAVMAVAVAVGWVANHVCPHALTLQQALHCQAL